MWFEQVLFFVAGIGALAGALGVVLLRNPFYSVLALVAHLLALAVLFLLLHAEFLAAAQVVVYAGAVMVLYVFVVAYIGGSDEPLRPEGGAINAVRAAVRGGDRRRADDRVHRAAGSDALDTRGRRRRRRLRLARRRSAQLLLHAVPGAVRGGLVPAAGGRGGRGRAGAPPARARGRSARSRRRRAPGRREPPTETTLEVRV